MLAFELESTYSDSGTRNYVFNPIEGNNEISKSEVI